MIQQYSLKPGEKDSFILKRGKLLKLKALSDGANVSALFYNRYNYLERYNMADTLKGQHTAKLTRGNCLYSDMGRSMISILEDSCGWHDPLGGVCTKEQVMVKYGKTSYQANRNDWYKNGRDNFIVEGAKHGLEPRDLVANVNFFSKVIVDEQGSLSFSREHCKMGMEVLLRMDMDLLVILSCTPHPLDTSRQYPLASVELSFQNWNEIHPPPTDDCTHFCPENERAHINTLLYYKHMGDY